MRQSLAGAQIFVLIGIMAIIGMVNYPAWAEAATGSISGTVTSHADNSALGGLSVRLYQGVDPNIADQHAWDRVGEILTDGNGYYQFVNRDQRRYRVNIPSQEEEVSGTRYAETDIYNVQVFDEKNTPDINFSVRQAGFLYGYVVTALGGTPIPNAQVVSKIPWVHNGHYWHSAWTDTDGRYELLVIPSPGEFYPVTVVKDSGQSGTFYEAKWDGNMYQATLTPTGTQVPDYQLEEAGAVTGRVVNENDVGVEGVRVAAEWTKYGKAVDPHCDTDGNGYFTLNNLPPGDNYIYLDNGWNEIEQGGVKYQVGEIHRGPITLSFGDTVDVGTFTIYEAGMVIGLVIDEGGVPIVGVDVNLQGRDIDGNYADRQDVVTDAFGQFTFDYVAPGLYNLTCRKEGFLHKVVTGVRVDKGAPVDVDDVVLEGANAAIVSGGIANYAVVAAHDSGGVQYPYYEGGDYSDFGLPEFGIIALSMDRDYSEEDFLNIESLFVGMVDQSNIEDGYADYFEPDSGETPGNYGMMLPAGDIAVGMYTTDWGLLPGDAGYAILHDWHRFNLTQGDVRPNVNFTADTAATGILQGDITVPAGYDFFPEDWCVIYAKNETGQTVVPIADAVAFPGWTTTYEYRGLPAGTYTLRAYARNLASVVISSVSVTAGQTTTQNITFTPGGTLTGDVSSAGSPIADAVVTLIESGHSAVTDASGNYTIQGITPGGYTVEVTASGYADAQALVTIAEGVSLTQNFVLSSVFGSIAGTVKDNNDININGATVLAYNETDQSYETEDTVAGAFSIAPLTPGDYIMAVDTDDYGVVVYPADNSRITLGENEALTGVVIVAGVPQPPLFTVTSTASSTLPRLLSMEFYSDKDLDAAPEVTVLTGSGLLGQLTSLRLTGLKLIIPRIFQTLLLRFKSPKLLPLFSAIRRAASLPLR